MRWRTKRGERFWVASTRRSRIFFALAIFCTFAGLSVLFDVVRATHAPLWVLVAYMAMAGLVATGYAFAALWDLRLLPLAIAVQVVLSLFGGWATDTQQWLRLDPAAEHARLVTDATLCFIVVAAGYSFSVRFIHSLARGHAELRTEV